MEFPTVNVTAKFVAQSGEPVSGIKVSATLSHNEIWQGFVIPKVTTTLTDDEGVAVLSLFPNEEGTEGSHYNFRFPNISQVAGHTTLPVVVPNADCNLWEIAALPPFPRISEIDMAALEVYKLRDTVDNMLETITALLGTVSELQNTVDALVSGPEEPEQTPTPEDEGEGGT